MHTYLNDAKEQLKRVDHLIYVSLKYTRTVDVLKSILKRLIAGFDDLMTALLKLNVELGKIPELPHSVVARFKTLETLYPHPEIKRLLRFQSVMRKLDRAEPIKSNEYRRGVRMSAFLGHTVLELDIDNVEEYFKQVQIFFKLSVKIIEKSLETKEPLDLEELINGVNIDMAFERG